jgi:hypothetical protein
MNKIRNKFFFISAVFLFFISSLIFFNLDSKSNLDIIKKIEYCFNIKNNIDLSVSCVEDVYEISLNEGNFNILYNHLQKIAGQEVNSHNFYICHKATHNSGALIVEKLGGVEKSINILDKPACGLIHAPYDIFGREKYVFSQWVELVNNCSKIQSKLDYYLQCDDAVGHAVVQSLSKHKEFYSDEYFSFKVCAVFDDISARINCGEGVIMERFGPLDPNVKPEEFITVDELINECLSLPSDILNAQEGCSYGVGWYLTILNLDKIKKSFINNDFRELFLQIKSDCSIFNSKLSDLCFERFKDLVT